MSGGGCGSGERSGRETNSQPGYELKEMTSSCSMHASWVTWLLAHVANRMGGFPGVTTRARMRSAMAL